MDSIGAWMSSSEKTAAAVARATRRRTWPGCGRWCCLCSARMAARTVLPPSNCGRRWRTTTACISSISYAESLRKPWGERHAADRSGVPLESELLLARLRVPHLDLGSAGRCPLIPTIPAAPRGDAFAVRGERHAHDDVAVSLEGK